jgi:hemerythrin
MPSPGRTEQAVQWSSSLSIGNATFDLAHRRCITALGRLETAPDRQYHCHLQALGDTLRVAFDDEERLMENMGFPELLAHRTQHKRVLAALREVESHTICSNFSAARELVALLPHWFLFHWVHMDTTLVVAADLAASAQGPAPPSYQAASGASPARALS